VLELITNDDEKTAPVIETTLDELARKGARRMIAEALELEVEEYIDRMRDLRDEEGHAQVVRNGRAQERTITLGAGAIEIRAPRVHDRRPEHRFTSKILPPYMRRSPRLEEALPVLYLRGLSTGDFQEALPVLLPAPAQVGPEAAGLSASSISRLLRHWQDEYQGWRKRSLRDKKFVYLWADGVYFRVRLEEDRIACLVIIGLLADGTKEVIALEEGYRESQESWASLLRDLKRRGMKPPMLAVGDGNLGFPGLASAGWAALRDVFPECCGQRCWVHKIANMLDKLPKRLQSRAKDMLHEIMYAPDRESAEEGMQRFQEEYEARYPKAVECLLKDRDALLTFFDFPAEHWIHLRTTNPIESPFATVKTRTRQIKGAGSRKAGLAMAFKLALSAQDHWRRVNAPQLVPLARTGVQFKNGEQVSNPEVRDTDLTDEEEAYRIPA
jgi:putative transposase